MAVVHAASHRYLRGALALIQNFLTAGVFYGWVALSQQLLSTISDLSSADLHTAFVLASSLSLLAPWQH